MVVKQNNEEVKGGSLLRNWAFVQLDFKRSASLFENILPRRSRSSIHEHQPSDYGVEDNSYTVRNDKTFPRGFGIMEKGRWYFKIGWTSNVTTGVCHGVEMDLNRLKDYTSYDNNGPPITSNIQGSPL